MTSANKDSLKSVQINTDRAALILGYLVEHLSGQSLDRFVADRVSAPFEMDSTRFGPLPADVVARCAPTEFDAEAGLRIKGTPHDYSARLLAVCGIAGVFSTAADLGRFLQHLLWAQDPLASWVAESLTVQTGSLGPARGFFWQPASGSDPVEDVWVHYGLPVQQCGSRPRSAGGQR